MKKALFSVILLFILISIKLATAQVSNRSEIRAAFFHQLDDWWSPGYDWNIMAQTLSSYKTNLCLIGASTRWGFDRDFVTKAITACHNNNIEAHILFGTLVGAPPNPDHRAMDQNLVPHQWYSPCKEGVRELIKSIVIDLATNFSIDGFNFDYIRYDGYAPSLTLDYSPECKSKFDQWLTEQELPPIGPNWPGEFAPGGTRYKEFMEWRVIPVTELVRDVREWMLAIKPNLEFSASVFTRWFSDDTPRYKIGQDTVDWVAKGYLDFVSPMIYKGDLATFQSYVNYVNELFVGGTEGIIPLAPFITTTVCGDGVYVTPEVFKGEVDYTREKTDGFMTWRYGGPGAGINNCPIDNNCAPSYRGSPSNCLIDITTYLNKLNETNSNGWFDTFALQNVSVEDMTGTSATIKWNTDKSTTSRVEYNTTPLFVAIKKPGYYFYYWDIDPVPGKIKEDSTNVTSHSIILNDLQTGMIYYYRVQSRDNFAMVTSKVYNFTFGEVIYFVNITGNVTDLETASPIQGATVSCGTYTSTTDANGVYFIKMTTPAPSFCNLTANSTNYTKKSISFSFTENKTYTNQNFVLEKTKYKITGRLRNITNDSVQAIVVVYQQDGSIIFNQTDANGNYTISLLPGVYDVQFNLTDFCIPNFYIKIPSVNVNWDTYDIIKYVNCYSKGKNISILFDVSEPKTIQIYGQTFPTRVLQNGTVIKNVSSLSQMKNNTWFYEDSSVKKLHFVATLWPVPICGNKVCEISEKETNDLYYCSVDCPSGLIGYWKLDEGSGNIAVESSGYGNNGTLKNNPTWTTDCVRGKCLMFDGSDDYIEIKKYGDFSKGFSIDFWFNMKQKGSAQRPYSSMSFSTCYITSASTTFVCYLGDGTDWSTSLYSYDWNYNSWYHFVMTYDPATKTRIIYKNGTAVATGSYDRTMTMTKNFAIGNLFWGTGYQDTFYGTLDEFAIFNRALTATEVSQHFQNGISV